MSPGSLHLFLGPDRASKLRRIHELERSLDIQALDRHQLDAAATTAAQLLALCRQQPALSPVRFIVVDQAHRLDRACVEALLQHADVVGKTTRLILLVETELSLRHPLLAAGKTITIERFQGREAPAPKPFALTDALGAQDVAGSLIAVHEQLLAGKEPLELLGLVAWQLQRWVMVKRLLRAGYSADGIAAATGLRLWQVERVQSEIARRPLRILQGLLARCWELDVDAKRGRTLPGLAIEQLVIEACQPAR